MNEERFACLVDAFVAGTIEDADRRELARVVAADSARAEAFRQQVRLSMRITARLGPDRGPDRVAMVERMINLQKTSKRLRVWSAVERRLQPRPRAAAHRRPSRRRPSRWMQLASAGVLVAACLAFLLVLTAPDQAPLADDAASDRSSVQQVGQAQVPSPPAAAWHGDDGQSHAPGARIEAGQALVLTGPAEAQVLLAAGAALTLPDDAAPLQLHAGRIELRTGSSALATARMVTPQVEVEGFATRFHAAVDEGATTVVVEQGRVRLTGKDAAVLELGAGEQALADAAGLHIRSVTEVITDPSQWYLAHAPKTGQGLVEVVTDPTDPQRQVLRLAMGGGNDWQRTWYLAGTVFPMRDGRMPTAIRLRLWIRDSSPTTRLNVNTVEVDGDAWAIHEGPLEPSAGWQVLEVPWQARYSLYSGGDGQWSGAAVKELCIGIALGPGELLLDQVEIVYEPEF